MFIFLKKKCRMKKQRIGKEIIKNMLLMLCLFN